MMCPNCGHIKLATIETFQVTNATIRTKKCPACRWTFTSREELCEDILIPKVVRHAKRKKVCQTEENRLTGVSSQA